MRNVNCILACALLVAANAHGQGVDRAAVRSIAITDVAPAELVEGQRFRITIKARNRLPMEMTGRVRATFLGRELQQVGGLENASVAPSGTLMFSMDLADPPIGSGELLVEWLQKSDCRQITDPRTNRRREFCKEAAVLSTSRDIVVFDQDRDGIPTSVERELLARFRPYYRFSLDDGADEYLPTDPAWYARHSALFEGDDKVLDVAALQDTAALWTYSGTSGSPDLRHNAVTKATDYRLNIDNDARKGGHDWAAIRSDAIGLMGHVAPIPVGENDAAKHTGYKIEYWQFYAYNDGPVPAARHEGDWEAVMLVVDKATGEWQRVTHNIHSKTATFVRANAVGEPDTDGPFKIFKGPNHGHVEWLILGQNTIGNADDNTLSFYCSGPAECTHPVVFIEHSGHASWPTAAWNWHGARKHGGDDTAHNYLVARPVNVGEKEHPTPECDACDLTLHFNGHWGGGSDGPEGPTLKDWAWGKP